MPEKKADLILPIHMTETTSPYDGEVRGSFDAYVYQVNPRAGYDDAPHTSLWGYESPWGGFAMHAGYGVPTIAHGGAYNFQWGFRPDDTLVRLYEAERITKGIKKAQTAYEKVCADYGRPQTLGQEVVYLMRALGIKTACHKITNGRLGSSHRDWRLLESMEDIRYYVDQTIEACRTRQLEDKAA